MFAPSFDRSTLRFGECSQSTTASKHSPEKSQDLPGKWPLAWKVPRKKAGPSGKMAPGMEGPPEKAPTVSLTEKG